jgi:hypothetical protein
MHREVKNIGLGETAPALADGELEPALA